MTPEEETLEKIKFVLLCNNDAQAIRHIENYGFWKDEQKENFAIGFYDYCETISGRLNDRKITIDEAIKLYKKENGL